MAKVNAKMDSIQNTIDSLMRELAETKVSEAYLVKDKIRAERAKLVPFANLRAAIASPNSRANHFPQHMEAGEAKTACCSDKFIQFVETQI